MRTANSEAPDTNPPAGRSRPFTVLVVDDHASVRDTFCTFLEDAGYAVLRSRNGKEALSFAVSPERVDLVITDILMPETDGLELIRVIRAKRPAVKILAISGGGHASPGLFLNVARNLGADRVREKPIRKDQLLSDVSELLAACRT